MKQLKIASSSVRGVTGIGLTPELVTDFACAFGTWVEGCDVVLARDTRRSSPMFEAAALSGLISTGCDVKNAGVCPTPVAQHLVRRFETDGAIVVTGSHNSSEWNALKFVNRDGALLNRIQGEEVLDLYHLGEFTKASWDRLGKEIPTSDYAAQYFDETVDKVDTAAIREAGFRVVVDLANGTAGTIIHDFLSLLGCKPVLINEEREGNFAHYPGPTIRNMAQLASLLKHIKADVGFAINTDADAVGVVTEKGEALSEECTFPLIADHLLTKKKALVVTNLSTSMMIDNIVEKHGGSLIRTKIGEGNVIFRAINENAYLAGEGSGGVACLPVACAFDAFMSMAFILEAMAKRGKKPSELRAGLPSFTMLKGEIAASSSRVYHALEETRTLFRNENVDLKDGVRVQWPNLWLHVRSSNTEPVLRVFVEGEDEDKAKRLFYDMVQRLTVVVDGKS